VSASGGGVTDWTAPELNSTDFMIGFKNSHVQLIQSIGIVYNGIDIIQPIPMLNSYLTFIQHSELSSDDEWLNSPLTGYCKDNSSSWYYNTPTVVNGVLTGDSRGCGIGNNNNFGLLSAFDKNDTHNEGFLKRQKLVNKIDAEKALVLGDPLLDRSKISAKSFIQNTAHGKFIYYDIVLRLKDACPNLFKNLKMTKGARLKITLTLNNNISFSFQKNANGNFVYNPSTFSNGTSETNPFMIASSYNKYRSQTGGRWQPTGANANTDSDQGNVPPGPGSGNFCFGITDATYNNVEVPVSLVMIIQYIK